MKKLLAFLMMLFLCASAATAETTMYLSVGPEDTHVLRAEPDKASEALGQYYPGTPVAVLDENEYWRKVRIGDQEGWLTVNYLSDTPTLMFGPVATVVNEESDWVNLRQGATTKSPSLARVEEYDKVLVLGETADGWTYVDWRNQRGFMLTAFVQEASKSGSPTAIVGEAGEDYIHQYTADNGQTIVFVSMEREPGVGYKDVNFDGRKDIVAVTAQGATNYSVAFFVWDGSQYVLARYPGTESLTNYALHPETGIVFSGSNNGFAGLLFHDCLFRWEGTNLRLIRRAVCEELTETSSDSERYTITTWKEILHARVWEYPEGSPEGVLIHDEKISHQDADGDLLKRINDILWQNIE